MGKLVAFKGRGRKAMSEEDKRARAQLLLELRACFPGVSQAMVAQWSAESVALLNELPSEKKRLILDRATLSRYECAGNQVSSALSLRKVAVAYGVESSDIEAMFARRMTPQAVAAKSSRRLDARVDAISRPGQLGDDSPKPTAKPLRPAR